jgi:two-component system OmpR family sensor kinase
VMLKRGEWLDLARELVRGVVDLMRESARQSGCVLSFDSPGALHGRWDRMRVEQVVTNLVANALKFGSHKPVEVEVMPQGAAARISVRDHGVGIEPQFQRRIFGRFERGVSARHFGGMGLGLWVAKQIVDAHGGTISVESTPGAGATFVVMLPLATPRALRRSA